MKNAPLLIPLALLCLFSAPSLASAAAQFSDPQSVQPSRAIPAGASPNISGNANSVPIESRKPAAASPAPAPIESIPALPEEEGSHAGWWVGGALALGLIGAGAFVWKRKRVS